LIAVSGDDVSSLTYFAAVAQGLSLDDFFDQSLPAEPLVV
jgi:hypothetical protein